MSGPKIKVARSGYDARTAENKNLALNTDLTILKIVKIIRSTSNQSIAHGLGYAPQVMFLRELSSSPKQIGHALSAPLLQSNNSSDSININFEKIAEEDSAVIAIVFADPFGDEAMATIDVSGRAVIEVRPGKLYSPYDTLKVFNSGILTLNVPEWTSSDGNDTNIVTTAYSHNLGYVPLFAPFIPAQTSLTAFYQWYWQWHNRHTWTTSTEYLFDDYVENPSSSGTFYICTQYHTSSSLTEPGSGTDWENYWILSSELTGLPGAPGEIPDRDIDINSLEDLKIVYGGISGFTDETVYVYATTTQLVIKYKRVDSQAFGYSTFPARTVNLSYTIFYNNVEEDLNLFN